MTRRRTGRSSVATPFALLCASSLLAALLAVASQPAGAITRSLARIAGADRYATSIALSVASYPTGAEHAVLASGADFPDGLAAGPLAALQKGPVLLTPPDALPSDVGAELVRLGVADITVVGGPTAVNDAVLDQVQATTGLRPARVFGADRYATAAAVASQFPAGSGPAYVASGTGFPDALAGGAAAAALHAPLLLVAPDRVSDAVTAALERLAPSEIRVLGGPAAVSDATVTAMQKLAPSVRRIAGVDRYATAAALATDAGAHPAAVMITTGINFPDALAASTLAAVRQTPIVLTDTSCAPTATVDLLRGLGWPDITAVGGTTSLRANAASIVPCVPIPDGLLAPGVTLTTQVLAGPRVVHILTVDRRQGYDVRPSLATGRLNGRLAVSELDRRWNALAAVNGDFFQVDGQPNHIVTEDGRLLQYPSDGTLVGLDPGKPSYGFFGIPQAVVDVQFGADAETNPLDLVNRGAPTGEQLALLTPESMTAFPSGEWCRAVLTSSGAPVIDSDDRTAEGSTVQSAGCGSGEVPRASDVLVAAPDSAIGKRIGALETGSGVSIRWKMQSTARGVLDVIGASNSLVFGAAVADDVTRGTGRFFSERAPRTAIGQRANGDLLIVVVDGRRSGYSIGMTERELADYMVGLGCLDAANLDGGGSSAMAVRGVLVSQPSDPSGERTVGSGLVIVPHGTPAPPPTAGATNNPVDPDLDAASASTP